MATNTDKQVQELFKVVQKKKSEIVKAEKPNWLTNCSFGYIKDSASRSNIQVINDLEELISILAFLLEKEERFKQASVELGLFDREFKWMGFKVSDWKTDIQTRIDKIQISKKKKDLEVLENRLNSLISPELKAQLELEEITKLLSNE